MSFWGLRVGMLIALLLAVSMLTFGAMNLLGDPLLFLGLGGVHLVVRRRRQQALRAPAISKD